MNAYEQKRIIASCLQPDEWGRLGVPGYAIRNTAAAVRRVDVRIAELEAKAAASTPDALEVPGARVVEQDNRVRVLFDERPSEAVRATLQREGFRWAPSVGAWQRLAGPLAWAAAKRVVEGAEHRDSRKEGAGGEVRAVAGAGSRTVDPCEGIEEPGDSSASRAPICGDET